MCIVEGDDDIPAARWIIQNVARLPLLADRILDYYKGESSFVTPSGKLLDQLDEAPTESEAPVSDALDCALSLLGRRPGGTASVVYLTSDAGEGKTTLITHMAREQARRYKAKQQDWLLVPVSLGGRTFMRFDDVIAGALMNRLRFSFLYYEAFIELVRLGVVVPAFDGFEEMFVEGSAGDAISALGNLVQSLQSMGAIMIAARKAYFEYKNLQTQTKLFDSLGGQSVSFARLALQRWDHLKFIEYANKRGIKDGDKIYLEVAAKLKPDHPLLTRAVLVRGLLDVAVEMADRSRLLDSIERDPADYFRQFVGTIIQREAQQKWLDKVGEVARPLISVEEHYELLSMIAMEMWQANTESLRPDIFDLTAELFSDSKKKDKVVTYQIVERLKQHALIIQTDGHRLAFDHQEFYHFFLGEAVGKLMTSEGFSSITVSLRHAILPGLASEAAARFLQRSGKPILDIVAAANTISNSEPRASFVKENIGGILIRLLDFKHVSGVTVRQASFPPQALLGRRLTEVEFYDCYFQTSSLDQSQLIRCRFNSCEFESLELFSDSVHDSVIDRCTVRAVIPINADVAIFAPQQVTAALTQVGFLTPSPQTSTTPVAPDEEMALVERMLRAFMRSTGINEHTLEKRLGAQSSQFFKDVLPRLEDAGVVQEMPYKGSGSQRRFKLGFPLDRLTRAVEGCQGHIDRFIALTASP